MSENNQHLTRRSITAGAWLTGYRFFSKLIGLGKTAIIARILTPAQFGVFGVVGIALNLFETFSETGIEQALIHKKNVSATDITTAWLISLARSILVGLVLFLTAPLFATFFEMPEVVWFIRAISITPILRSLRNPELIFFKKKLDFKQEALMLSIGSFAEVVVGIWVTLLTRDVWGLVAAILAGGTAELIASYVLIKLPKFGKPKLSSFYKLINFGRWIWASSALSYLVNQADDIIVGKLLGAASLGYYQNAFKLASLPATQITGTITQVTFPAFASIQDDKTRLHRAFKKSLLLTSVTTLPPSIITILFAQPITLLIYGQQWLPMVPVLKVLAIFGIIRSLSSLIGPLATAIGKPQFITINGIVRAIILFALIIPFSNQMGVVGAAWATVIAIFCATLVTVYQLKRALDV